MAVTANQNSMPGGDTGREHQESSHEFNFFADRQLQNKLLQADDSFAAENHPAIVTARPGGNLKSVVKHVKTDSFKFDLSEDLTGWIPDSRVIGRKATNGKNDSSVKSKENTFIHPWKDYNKKQQQDTFVFKHYTDSRKYIEQYRANHGCHNAGRFSAGHANDTHRRYPVQASAPPAQVQTVWNGTHVISTTPNQGALHYTQRKGDITVVNGNSNCSCTKSNHAHSDPASQAHKYKLVASPFLRANTEIRSQHDSDNSSECGDTRTPRSRINSASSIRSRSMIKSPTKISVPSAGIQTGRNYPIQALTMQQSNLGKSRESPINPKPLDNLACVAPEKQGYMVERKQVEPVNSSLQVRSLNDLLSANDAPLRGYALPKSSPPPLSKTNHSNAELESIERKVTQGEEHEAGSLAETSACSVSPERHIRSCVDPEMASKLEMFFTDPVLSQLNQKPSTILMPQICSKSTGISALSNSTNKLFSQDIEGATADSNLQVGMWNPGVSMTTIAKPQLANKEYHKTMLPPSPFKKNSPENASAKEVFSLSNPEQMIKLSITRMEPAVSFCRTHVTTSPQGRIKNTVIKAYDSFAGKGKLNNDVGWKQTLPQVHGKIFEKGRFDRNTKNMCTQETGKTEVGKTVIETLTGNQEAEKNMLKKMKIHTGKGNHGDKTEAVSQYPSSASNLEPPLWKLTSYRTNKDFNLSHHTPGENPHHQLEDITIKILHGLGMEAPHQKGHVAGEEVRQIIERKAGNSQGNSDGSCERRNNKRGPSLASGNLLRVHPDLEGLTWTEKLEFLRSVNKKPVKQKPKQQKLKFVSEIDNEHEQLYEQRRIRHLVEQARLKGPGKQFDWVYESKMRVRSIDWGTGKFKSDPGNDQVLHSSDSSQESSQDSEQSGEANGTKTGVRSGMPGQSGHDNTYKVAIGRKGGARKTLALSHSLQRSSTCFFQS